MRRSRTALAIFGFCSAFAASAELVHSERSLYQNILVVEQNDQRCLQFTVRHDPRNQTCIYLSDRRRMVFAYTQMMLAALLLDPEPKRILMIGLGGGTIPSALAELLPDAAIDVVEIDPAVVAVAKRFFSYAPSAHTRLFVQDARVFGKRAALGGNKYDLVLLDAYNGDYIPEHLMTREYLEETRSLLAPGGVLAANTFAISRLYHHESVTYEMVFGRFVNLRLPESANRIVIVDTGAMPSPDVMRQRAAVLAPKLAPYGVPIEQYVDRMTFDRDWNTAARPLTDQYSPANLLRELE
jgi:spermidine synthase